MCCTDFALIADFCPLLCTSGLKLRVPLLSKTPRRRSSLESSQIYPLSCVRDAAA